MILDLFDSRYKRIFDKMASKSEGKRLLEEDEEMGADDKRLKSEGKFSLFY